MSRKTRKSVNERQLRRRKPIYDPFSRILLVFEGESTEPTYFKDLCTELRLPSQSVVTLKHSSGCDPLSIVRRAIRHCEEDGDFEKVFCIVDKDRHQTYQQAVNLVASHPLGRKGKIVLITSNPCFEVWLLIHFKCTTGSIRDAAIPGSDGAVVVKELKVYLPQYTKKCNGVFERTKANLNSALDCARQLREHHGSVGGDGNPSSEIDFVIDELRKMQQERNSI